MSAKPTPSGRNIDWRKSPCPDVAKGKPCPVCGSRYVCTQTDRPKPHELAQRKQQHE